MIVNVCFVKREPDSPLAVQLGRLKSILQCIWIFTNLQMSLFKLQFELITL